MAIYHLSMKIIGGGSGRTAIGAASYRRWEKLHNEHDGKTHDYTRRRGAVIAAAYHRGDELSDGKNTYDFTNKKGIVYNEIILPKHAPREYLNSQTLWNAAQNAEKQHNARTAREIVIALPNELTPEQKIKVTRDYVQRNFVDEGMCADFSIHAGHIHTRKGEIYPFEDLAIQKENPHVHIQLTVRPLNEDGTFCKTKTRKEYIFDKNGERIRTESGKGWVSRNVGLTDWDKKETLLKWRENWAVTVNKEFERLGIDERISHLSLEEQGINREPTKHMGHEAWNLEKKGIKTEIGNENRAIMARNKALSHEVTAEATAEYMQDKQRVSDKLKIIKNKTCNQDNEEVIRGNSQNEYKSIDDELYEISEKRREIQRLNSKAKDMTKYSTQVRDQRGREYFKRLYDVYPEAAGDEIQRLKARSEELERELQEREKPILERKSAIESKLQERELLLGDSVRRKIYERTR